MKKLLKLTPFILAALVLSACSSSDEGGSASGDTTTCSPDSLQTVEAGVLTIATGEPAYEPWVLNDAPESGEGFEAAVAYAVAEQLGYEQSQVKWIRTTFDGAIAPGPKNFDFNIQQYSITEERAKVVDFSSAYYQSNQSIVSFKGSKIEGVTSIADLQAKNPKLGAAVASTSLDAIENQLGLKAQVFNDNAAAVAALKNAQIDGLVVDLPTAFYLSAVEVPKGIIVGQLENSASNDAGAGLLLAKDSPITSCVTQAVDAIRDNGTLAAITEKWLAASAGAPFLK
ncbi:MAG: amino acid ABC transporter substrate-binding protein [Actinobacteria bacterium]|jgi:polar amino acid transport system substrate-binding protein|nr:amino acid ABC transporter substrate-binding protein [Actinomycetota bacterium]